jgi:hypothetical protein
MTDGIESRNWSFFWAPIWETHQAHHACRNRGAFNRMRMPRSLACSSAPRAARARRSSPFSSIRSKLGTPSSPQQTALPSMMPAAARRIRRTGDRPCGPPRAIKGECRWRRSHDPQRAWPVDGGLPSGLRRRHDRLGTCRRPAANTSHPRAGGDRDEMIGKVAMQPRPPKPPPPRPPKPPPPPPTP